jgi:uncharacterized protein YjaG (DUF416 family)
MERFDERDLIARLRALPPTARVAFAASCAERVLPGYDVYVRASTRGAHGVLRHALDRVHRHLNGDEMDAAEVRSRIDEVMQVIPVEGDGKWVQEQAYAEDAAAAVAYVLRAVESGDPQEAAWAARRAYEALDQYAINMGGIDVNQPGAEAAVLARAEVQAELSAQRADIEELERATESRPVTAAESLVRLQERARRAAHSFEPHAP